MNTFDNPLWALIHLIDSIEFALHPAAPKQVDPKDAWFRSKSWQAAERQAEADLRAGRYEDFRSIERVVAVLLQNVAADDPHKLDRVAAALRQSQRKTQ